MTPRVVRRPPALRDMTEHYTRIGHDSPASAVRFLESCEATFSLLAQFPEMGSRWQSQVTSLQDIRCRKVVNFRNHIIFYRAFVDRILILRVLHGAQDLENIEAMLDIP